MELPFILEINPQSFIARGAVRTLTGAAEFFYRQDRDLFPEITLGQFLFRVARMLERKAKG